MYRASICFFGLRRAGCGEPLQRGRTGWPGLLCQGSQRRTEPVNTFPFEGELCSAVCCPYAWWEGRSKTREMMNEGSPRLSAGRVSSLPYKGFLPLT